MQLFTADGRREQLRENVVYCLSGYYTGLRAGRYGRKLKSTYVPIVGVVNNHFHLSPHDKRFSGERRTILCTQIASKCSPIDLSESGKSEPEEAGEKAETQFGSHA